MATPDPDPSIDLSSVLSSELTPEPDSLGRRKHPRKILRNSAQIRFQGGELAHVYMLDISEGGFSVVASANPRPDMTCVARLTVPAKPYGGIPIEAQATVVHSFYSSADSGFKVGLKFTKLSPEGYTAIVQFVNS